MICAARKMHLARSWAETFFQVSKYLWAASMACVAISAVACWKTPMTCEGREGFVEWRLSLVVTFWPPSQMGYSWPNSEATFFSASSMRARFSGLEKSMKGSLVKKQLYCVRKRGDKRRAQERS